MSVKGAVHSVVVSSLAQQTASQGARKIDSYNDKIKSGEAEQWHLEDFLKELAKEPTSKAYVIAYGGREDNPGKANRFALRAKAYMVEARGIDPLRIITVDGGRKEDFVVELWIVPNGSPPPIPTPTLTPKDDLGDNLLFDGFEIGCEGFSCGYENDAAHLDAFAAALKKEPGSCCCIVAYSQSGDDRMGGDWDVPGSALKTARNQKNYLIKKHRFASTKLTAIDGGYSWRGVELWLMRPNARFDKGPFVYRSRLRPNKGGTLMAKHFDTFELCCRACARGHTDPYMLRNEKPRKTKLH